MISTPDTSSTPVLAPPKTPKSTGPARLFAFPPTLYIEDSASNRWRRATMSEQAAFEAFNSSGGAAGGAEFDAGHDAKAHFENRDGSAVLVSGDTARRAVPLGGLPEHRVEGDDSSQRVPRKRRGGKRHRSGPKAPGPAAPQAQDAATPKAPRRPRQNKKPAAEKEPRGRQGAPSAGQAAAPKGEDTPNAWKQFKPVGSWADDADAAQKTRGAVEVEVSA